MTMMRWFSTLRLRVRTLFQKKHVERELNEELMFHVEHQVEALIAQGVSPVDARRIAMKSLGGVERQMERCRDVRAWQWVEILRADVVFGWRQLLKNKVTTAAAVLSLALGIGSCVAAFQLVDALFLRPLPVAHAERLYGVFRTGPDLGDGKIREETSFEYPLFQEMRDAVKEQAVVMAVGYIRRRDITYQSAVELEKAQVQYVSGSMFGTFSLQPTVGRLLMESDDLQPGAHPVAVLSYDYWLRRFGKNPNVIGRVLHMGNASTELGDNIYQIIGVGPKEFTGTEPGTTTDIFLPTMMSASTLQRTNAWLRILVSLKPGVAAGPVNEHLNAVFEVDQRERAKGYQERTKQYLERFLNWHTRLKPASAGISTMQGDYERPLQALCVLAALVLLISCGNVGNLMSGQATARAKEMAMRISLGAGRGRLARLMMIQSAMLGMIAAGLGILFAVASAPMVMHLISTPSNPVQLILCADWRTVVFAVALTFGVSMMFGLIPALRASAVQPVSALKGGEERFGKLHWMQVMIASQIAFCLLVLFFAVLFVTTFGKLTRQPLGFRPENVITLVIGTQRQQSAATWERIRERLRSVPGVKEVSLSTVALLSGETFSGAITVDGTTNATVARFLAVSPGWMQTMGISIVAGRDLRESVGDPGEAVISKTFARTYFGETNPVGKTFEAMGRKKHRLQVAGVVNDALYQNMRDGTLPVFYIPYQWGNVKDGMMQFNGATFVVRSEGSDPMSMGGMLRRTIVQEEPDLRVNAVQTEVELVESQTVREHLLAMLSGFFAVVALLLAAIGLYGVLHYSVVQREKEIGIRIALGAAAGNIARLITVRVMFMVVGGAVVGLVAGMASVRYIAALLYGVKATDPSMLMVPAAVLLAVACLAALPAVMRAVQIDPAVMLRAE